MTRTRRVASSMLSILHLDFGIQWDFFKASSRCEILVNTECLLLVIPGYKRGVVVTGRLVYLP